MRSAQGCIQELSGGRRRVIVEMPRDPITGKRRQIAQVKRDDLQNCESRNIREVYLGLSSQIAM